MLKLNKMEIGSEELHIIEDSLNSKIEVHKQRIEAITKDEDSHYQNLLKRYRNLKLEYVNGEEITLESLKNKDVIKELEEIKKIELFKSRLFNSDSYLYLIPDKLSSKVEFTE